MKKKRRKEQTPSAPPEAVPEPFSRPFESLAALKKNLAAAKPAAKNEAPAKAAAPPPPPPPPPTDQALFMAEMADVRPVKVKTPIKAKTPRPVDSWPAPELPNEDLEALRQLSELVGGRGEFDLSFTDEYVEGRVKGLPPVLMEQLRSGRIPFQDHLDLHGCTVAQAEAAVIRFILDSVALGRGCVLLIHGRGQGSRDGVPVLKRNLEQFLLRGPARKYILAFTTARPIDGGLGASYILLRR